MTEQDLKSLILKVKEQNAETQMIEIKKAKSGCPKSLYDTLSSFSNQNDGGIILFGLDEENRFDIVGVYDCQDLQTKVMEQCNEMSPQVRALFSTVQFGEKVVLAAEIPPIDQSERPCFYKGKGKIKGSYIRVGNVDLQMNEYEVYSYEAYRKKYKDDIRPVEKANFQLLNKVDVDKYIAQIKENKPNIATLETEQIYELMSITQNGFITLSSVLLFSIYPQAFFRQLAITAVAVPGIEIGETDTDGTRFLDNKRIEGTIPQMLDEAVQFVKKNMRTKTIIDETGKRVDKTDYPIKAIREIILNALVHRDYSHYTEGLPIQLKMFDDRFEVSNPGGLYGRMTLDSLGKMQPDTRNPVLATALEIMKITENRYSGIPTIRKEMQLHGLPEPVFSNERGEFKVCLYRYQTTEVSLSPKQKALLEFCKTPRTRNEIANHLGLSSVTYATKKFVVPLIEQGLIYLSIPDAPSSSNQLYFSK